MKKIKVPIVTRKQLDFDIMLGIPNTKNTVYEFDCYEQFYIENPDLRYWYLDEATAKYKSWIIQKVLNEL